MKVSTCLTVLVATGALLAGGCASSPQTPAQQAALNARSNGTLEQMKALDPNLSGFLDRSYGYAIFPSVGKGGFIVGGGYGRGEVYEQGQFIGFADMSQATIGLQAGGQTFSELIAFQDKESMDRFKYGKMKLSASASAVALKAGASTQANYSDGVAVFTLPQGGLMFEAAIGGQEFGFVPADEATRDRLTGDRSGDASAASAFDRQAPSAPAAPPAASDNGITASGQIQPSGGNADAVGANASISADPSTRPADLVPATQPSR